MAFTEQQKLFIIGKKILADIDEIEKTRPLSSIEESKRNDIKEELFGAIIRYGMSEAHTIMSKYKLPSGAYSEVHQLLAVTFFEHLNEYDPIRSAPTTFYAPYFRQVIAEFVRNESQHLKQYDARNVARVRAAIKEYDLNGISWTPEMISTKTGLSMKVVLNTLKLAQNSQYAQFEDIEWKQSNTLTPEQEYLKTERFQAILLALQQTLGVHERDVFLYKVNLDGSKERSIQEVAKKFHMSPNAVKQMFNCSIAKLQNNPILCMYYDMQKHQAEPDIEISLHDVSGDIVETQILEFFVHKENEQDNSKE